MELHQCPLISRVVAIVTKDSPLMGSLIADEIFTSPATMTRLTSSGERIALNYYLRCKLGQLNINTSSARECLNEIDSEEVWVRNFEIQILPAILY